MRTTFETTSEVKHLCWVFLKSCKNFSKKNHLFFQKSQNFERLETSWAVVKIEAHFDKKTCKIKRFRKFSLGFLKRFISFSKKNTNSDFFSRNLEQWELLVGLLEEICSVYFFWELASIFLIIPSFLQNKTFLNVFWARLINNTIRYAFFEIFPGTIDFQKTQGFFPGKKPSFFPETPILNILEILREKENLRHIFEKNCQI